MQTRALREYVARRGWTLVMQIREVGSGAIERHAREQLMDAARRREIDVVLVWRLDPWGRSVTDLLATLQELEHLGVGFVSLTEALDLTTPAGRAMAGLLAIFAEFEREILRERTRAGLAHARQNGKRLGRPMTAGLQATEIRKLYRAGVAKAEIARRLAYRAHLGAPHSGSQVVKKPKQDPIREDRIHNQAIVDAYGPEEKPMSWYYYLESKLTFPFNARCIRSQATSPLRKGETVEVRRLAKEEACESDMLVQIQWQGRKMAVPLSQLAAIHPDESTAEAIGDWHYWVAQGYLF